MNSEARYAIYLAPEQGSLLARFISGILGYDAFTGQDVTHPDCPPDTNWHAITTGPRRYGAHATLKAPFHLAPGTTRSELENAMVDFAAKFRAFDIGPLAITCLSRDAQGGFIALTNPHDSVALKALEAEAVRYFEPLRAALSPTDIARRNTDQLTVRQRENLAAYGYPFVLDDYAFHITLTNRLAAPEVIADVLADQLAQRLGTVRFRVDSLYLFEQPAPEARFTAVRRFALMT